jgi:hypothetical protein
MLDTTYRTPYIEIIVYINTQKGGNMKTFNVYQITVSDEVYDFVNTDGESHASAGERYPEYKAHLDTMILGFKAWSDSYFKYYNHVCDVKIEGNNLEDVFVALNSDSNQTTSSIVKHTNFHSLSVGDIVEDDLGNFYFCDSYGFKRFNNPRVLHEEVIRKAG